MSEQFKHYMSLPQEQAVRELLMVYTSYKDETDEQLIELAHINRVLEENLKIQTEEAIELRHKWAIAEEFISADDMVHYRGDLASYNDGVHHLITRGNKA